MKLVSNSSPLIALAKIEKLSILKSKLIIPRAVFVEVTEPRIDRHAALQHHMRMKILNGTPPHPDPLPRWGEGRKSLSF